MRDRLANRVQLTSDGHKAYLDAVETAFGDDVDYAMLEKLFGQAPEGQRRYSPPVIVGTRTRCCTGKPDPKHISTSYAERQNLTMRMHMRRFTRLTNGFSKKFENHAHMVAIYAVWYNWIRIHKTLRVTPAMAAELTDRLWGWEDLVAMMDADQPRRSAALTGKPPPQFQTETPPSSGSLDRAGSAGYAAMLPRGLASARTREPPA